MQINEIISWPRDVDGQIESVRYYERAPMLLNEIQQAAIQQLSS